MNGKKEQRQVKKENGLQEETNQKKTFVQDIFNIDYVNTSKILYQQSSHSMDVKVNNYLCYQEGNNLYKVTEIIYEDKLIRIQDKFKVSVDQDKLKITPVSAPMERREKKGSKNIEKVRIFAKDVRKNSKNEKKDKKNIVKNLVKIFISWLEKKQAEKAQGNWGEALAQLKAMLQKENFNNRLIKNIVNSKESSKAFLCFLTDDAPDQIKYSRIQDKDSHYEAIELYISLLGETSGGQEALNSESSPYEPSRQSLNGNSHLQSNNRNSSMVQISSNNNRVTHPKVVSSLKHPFPQDSGDEYSASIKNEN